MNNLIKNFTNKDVVAVALSGGKDSMALLYVLYNILPQGKIKAINVEHGIRGEESKKDTKFVVETCNKLGVEIKCYQVDALTYCRENSLSVEEGARILRYGCFLDAVNSGFCTKVATAHHLSDSVETILFNLFRGSGTDGLAGIEERDYIIRPFLDISRQEIDLYVQKNGIAYVEDSTNNDQSYTRNYIRNTIIPLVKERFPEVERAIGRFSKINKEQDEFILSLARKELLYKDNEISFKEDLPKAIKYNCIILCFKSLGLEKDYEFRHCLEVDKLLTRKNGDVIDFPKNIKCVKDYGNITFYKERKGAFLERPFTLGEIDLQKEKLVIGKDVGGLKFDLDKLPKDCVIRNRKEGDEFAPFGSGSKKLKKYLIDKKIPCRQRDGLLVIAKQAEVFLVVGVEISDKIKVTKETKNVCNVNIIKK